MVPSTRYYSIHKTVHNICSQQYNYIDETQGGTQQLRHSGRDWNSGSRKGSGSVNRAFHVPMLHFSLGCRAPCSSSLLARCQVTCSGTTSATLYYTAPAADLIKHGEYVGFTGDPTVQDPSLPQLVDARVTREVIVRDARMESFAIPSHGFELRQWPTRLRNFDSSSAVERAYVPEVKALVAAAMRASGARGVRAIIVWDLCLRSSKLVNEFQQVAVQATDAEAAGMGLDRLAPVPLVHADFFGADDVRRRFRQRSTLPTDTLSTFMCINGQLAANGLSSAAELRRCMRRRIVGLNVWRSIDANSPVRRCPLALCEPQSLACPSEELVPFEIHCPDVSFSEAHVLADGAAGHRWWHYPLMRREECLLFVTGDTAGQWQAVPHTSFDDPRTATSDPPRTSIEARVFVVFDDHR